MDKPKKTDLEKEYGIKGFLIPLQVLPENLNLFQNRSYHKLKVTGQIVEVEGTRFFEIEEWKI